jgi:undecaprenyl pyrophosphate phosphatase UppP
MLEVLKAMGGETLGADVSWPLTIYGCLLSAAVGYFSLKLLVMTLKGRWFWLFGPYCIFVGILTVICG